MRLVRSMPNTPALVAKGPTAFVANPKATEADRAAARVLFESVGTAWEAPSEGLLDAVTGLSGSGPAYVFAFLEALGDAGVRMGLPRDASYALATQTVLGAARLALESGRHPAELREQVTSPWRHHRRGSGAPGGGRIPVGDPRRGGGSHPALSGVGWDLSLPTRPRFCRRRPAVRGECRGSLKKSGVCVDPCTSRRPP